MGLKSKKAKVQFQALALSQVLSTSEIHIPTQNREHNLLC